LGYAILVFGWRLGVKMGKKDRWMCPYFRFFLLTH